MAGGNEHLLHREDSTIHADDIIALLHGLAPPVVLEVALELGTKRAKVPTSIEPAIKLARLENESAAFAQRNDLLHAYGVGEILVGHGVWVVGAEILSVSARCGKTGISRDCRGPPRLSEHVCGRWHRGCACAGGCFAEWPRRARRCRCIRSRARAKSESAE